ncbi:MAG: hypothetical protein WCV62_04120 [Candidatus Peribacteraceae bacterium]
MRSHSSPLFRLVSAGLALLLLSACGGGGEQAVCTQQFCNGRVGICLPDGWTVMERERLDQQGIPRDVLAAFQVEKPVSGQYPTVVITEEPLAQPMDTDTYSRASMRAVSALPGYELIDTRPVRIDERESGIHIYTAQPAADQPKTRFYQVSAVSSSGTGYTVTAFAPLSVSRSLEGEELAMVQSLTFVDPGEGNEE